MMTLSSVPSRLLWASLATLICCGEGCNEPAATGTPENEILDCANDDCVHEDPALYDGADDSSDDEILGDPTLVSTDPPDPGAPGAAPCEGTSGSAYICNSNPPMNVYYSRLIKYKFRMLYTLGLAEHSSTRVVRWTWTWNG